MAGASGPRKTTNGTCGKKARPDVVLYVVSVRGDGGARVLVLFSFGRVVGRSELVHFLLSMVFEVLNVLLL
jgi:hypothetical protein